MISSVFSIEADPVQRVPRWHYNVLITCRTALAELRFDITSSSLHQKIALGIQFLLQGYSILLSGLKGISCVSPDIYYF